MFIIVEIKTLINDNYGKRNIPLCDVKYCCDSYETAIELLKLIKDTSIYRCTLEGSDLIVEDLGRSIWNIRYRIRKVPLYGTTYDSSSVYNLRSYKIDDITLIDSPYKYIDFGWYSDKDYIRKLPIYRMFIHSYLLNIELEVVEEENNVIAISKTGRVVYPFLSIVEYRMYKHILLL